MAKCVNCGADPSKQKVTLHRINPVGEDGIFVCQENCGAKSDDEEFQKLVNVIREGMD